MTTDEYDVPRLDTQFHSVSQVEDELVALKCAYETHQQLLKQRYDAAKRTNSNRYQIRRRTLRNLRAAVKAEADHPFGDAMDAMDTQPAAGD